MDRPLFSEMLAERRRQLGYSIRQASRVLRLREDILIAFEEGNFEEMPKSGYAQGMISSYARYLGLDANEVVDAYINDYERYRREERRRGAGRGSRNARRGAQGGPQPYVAKRGLLPSSGGPAGDMGSFATTRVHTRTGSSYVDDGDAGDTDGYDEYNSYNGYDSASTSYSQIRPYTARTPTRTRRTYRSNYDYSRSDIQTMGVEGYNDDLYLGRDAQPFESASTRAGRRSSRNASGAARPRVNRGSRGSGRDGGRSSRSSGRGKAGRRSGGSSYAGPSRIVVLVVIAAIVILSIILVLSVSSCVSSGVSASKTVPVSTVSDSSASSTSDTEGAASQSQADSTTTTSTTNNTSSNTTNTNKETSVSVSVADGSVTWLEVECDGKSDVAETITGPWQKTYTVEDAITIQAGDTTAVSVVQNGRQVQFDSMASGIGSIRIQGTKKTTETNDDKDSKTIEKATESASTAKMGNANSNASNETEATDAGEVEAKSSDEEYDYGG